MFKIIKERVLESLIAHSKLVTFGIGFAIAFVVGAALGIILDPHHALAVKPIEG